MGRVFAAALLGLAALTSAVGAVPCTLATIRSEYWRHQDRTETFVLVRGSFENLRFVRHERRRDRVIWHATFTGFAASSRAFDRPFAARVTLIDRLFTGMEGSNPDPQRLSAGLSGIEGMVFLQRVGEDYLVQTDFCAPILFPDLADVRPALNCLAGRRCPRE